MPFIGIDLGTTYSCVGVYQNGKVDIITNNQGNRTTPSYVAFTDSERHIGDAAKNQAGMNPSNTVFDAKRLIGRKYDDPKNLEAMKNWPFKVVGYCGKPKMNVQFKGKQKQFTPEEISSMVLYEMKRTAETFLNETVTDAVITVPANFNDSQRQATMNAGHIAGFKNLHLINEPTAAALAYGLHNELKGEHHVLIFDLGGGTFDVSVVTIKDGSVVQVRSTAGDTHLGGEDFDNILVNHLAEEFAIKHDKDLRSNPRALRRLRTAAERAKCTLSSSAEAIIEIDDLFEGLDLYTKISRGRFEELCAHLLSKILGPVNKALNDAKIRRNQIHDVVLVGGSTRIPKVQNLLKQFFYGKNLNLSINPDEAVAYGAAVQAAILSPVLSIPLRDVFVLDVAPHSLGFSVKNGVMSPVFKRNCRIPCTKTKIFSTSYDYQPSISIAMYEGERIVAMENNALGVTNFCGLALAPRGVSQIEATFDISANGILNITAKERRGGRTGNIYIRNHKDSLNRYELDRMVREAEEYAEEDRKRGQLIIARNELESYVYYVKKAVEQAGDKLSESDKSSMLEKCNRTFRWLENNTTTERALIMYKLRHMSKFCGSRIKGMRKNASRGQQRPRKILQSTSGQKRPGKNLQPTDEQQRPGKILQPTDEQQSPDKNLQPTDEQQLPGKIMQPTDEQQSLDKILQPKDEQQRLDEILQPIDEQQRPDTILQPTRVLNIKTELIEFD